MTGTAPAVPQIPAGYAPIQADMDSWITTPFTFLTSKAVFRGQRQAAQPLSGSSTPNLIQLDTIPEDPYGGWSATNTGSQPAWSWLCPAGCSGWYSVSVTAMTAPQGLATSSVAGQLWVSGSLWAETSVSWGVNANTSGSSGGTEVPLLGGTDYVQMFIASSAAVSTPTNAGRFPEMEIQWISG